MPHSNTKMDRIILLQQRLPEMPIIVLSKQPDLNSNTLDIQDYVIGGETIIPLFSSQDAFKASLGGADLGRPIMKISRILLVNFLRGHEIFLLDPQLADQLRFTADELRQAFPEPIPPRQ